MSHTPPPGIPVQPDPSEELDPAALGDDFKPADTIPLETPWPTLTTREREVADMLVRGLKNSEIGAALGVSVKTIDTHRANLLGKLGKRNNVELTRYAYANGWTSNDESENRS